MERYESYKDSGVKWIGEIPSHWGMYKLKYLFKLNKTKNVGNKCNTILSLSYGKIKIKQDLNEGLTPESYEGYQLLNEGDIVIRSTDLQNDHTSLRTGLVKNDGAITSAYIGLKNLDKKKYDSRYYHYFLHDWDITKAIYNEGKGLRQSLNWDDIKNMLLPELDINEQTAIANYLDSVTSKIDEAISQQQKMIDLLNERKQIIIQNAVTKGLDPNVKMKDSGVEWIGEIPEDWEVIRMRYLCKITTGNKDTINRVEDGIYPFYVRSPKVERINTYTFDGEAILMAGDGVGAGKIFHYVNGKFGCHQRVYIFYNIKIINGLFLFYYLKSLFKHTIEQLSAKSTVDSVRLNMIQDFLVAIPSNKEQLGIISYLQKACKKIDSSISQCNQMITLLQERKQIIINDVVTGKVKVV